MDAGLAAESRSHREARSRRRIFPGRHADGTGNAQRLTESQSMQLPRSWHPNGRILAFEEQTSPTNWDVRVLPIVGDDASGVDAGQADRIRKRPGGRAKTNVLA